MRLLLITCALCATMLSGCVWLTKSLVGAALNKASDETFGKVGEAVRNQTNRRNAESDIYRRQINPHGELAYRIRADYREKGRPDEPRIWPLPKD